ncbi:PPC domain [Dillenia turbinata]|uniref:AT-hook motif nuclear-localized protein n=1 Tax=Dillenia turbinata TaxID=194707 RepID=A0AAN8ZUM0_9MAGN
MDSREPTTSMLMGPNTYTSQTMISQHPNSSPTSIMIHNHNNSTQRFPFNSSSSAASKPFDSLNSPPFDGSQALRSGGFNIDSSKKKRGRPRKYSGATPDGNIDLGLSPTPISSSVGHVNSVTTAITPTIPNPNLSTDINATPSSDTPAKRNRGRPPGSGKKQLDALGGYGGLGFTPHVITVKAGEDIASKIMAFSQQGPRTICILSASGAICNVTLRQPAMSGGTVTYEGRYEIISLSGSYLLSEGGSNRSRTGGLSVSLAGSDGRVLGGGVAGMLMAASPVQVVVGSFIADGKKKNSSILKSGSSPALPSMPHMLGFSVPVIAASPPSPGASSDSSDENGSSPIHRGPGPFGGQPIHNMPPMYSSMGWANSTMKMLPN